jgi:hypothetical protein
MRHPGFEPGTPWLKVKCSTDWANIPNLLNQKNPIKNAQSRNRTSDTRIFSPLLYRLSYLGKANIIDSITFENYTFSDCGDRIWTYDLRVMSPTSFQTAPPRDIIFNYFETNGWRRIRTFESVANRFTVCPLWPLGNPSIFISKCFHTQADDRTRTDNLLITSQLLCQLSHVGIF